MDLDDVDDFIGSKDEEMGGTGAEGGTERGARRRGTMGKRSLTISRRLSIPHAPQQQKVPKVPEGGTMKFFGTDIQVVGKADACGRGTRCFSSNGGTPSGGGGREVEVDSGGVGDFEVETLRKRWTRSRSAPGAKTESWVSKPRSDEPQEGMSAESCSRRLERLRCKG